MQSNKGFQKISVLFSSFFFHSVCVQFFVFLLISLVANACWTVKHTTKKHRTEAGVREFFFHLLRFFAAPFYLFFVAYWSRHWFCFCFERNFESCLLLAFMICRNQSWSSFFENDGGAMNYACKCSTDIFEKKNLFCVVFCFLCLHNLSISITYSE